MTFMTMISILVSCSLTFYAGRIYELRKRMDHWHQGFEEAKRIYAAGKHSAEDEVQRSSEVQP